MAATPAVAPRQSAVKTERGPLVVRARAARPWISRTGTRAQRQTLLLFRLSRDALIELTFTRVAPDCRVVGTVHVRGHAGVNKVVFRGRLRGRALPPGTYRITARTLRPRRVRAELSVVIVGRPSPAPGVIAVARRTNACAPVEKTPEVAAATPSSTGTPPAASPPAKSRLSRLSGVLGDQFTRAADLVREVPPFLFPVLVFAILLLALATIPRRAAPTLRLQAILAYHREWVVLAGTVTLISVLITYAIW